MADFFCDLCDRFNGADLIVCKHDGNENGLFADQFPQNFGLYKTVLADRKNGNVYSLFFEKFCGRFHRRMFDGGDDDVRTNLRVVFFECAKNAHDRKVVAFGAA